MSYHRAVAFLALVATAACSDTTGPETRTVRSAERVLSATIVGPRIAAAPGLYQWTADVRGASGEVFYEWSITGMEDAAPFPGSAGPQLTLDLDRPMTGDIEIALVVRSGDQAVHVSERVQVCPQRHPVDWCFPDYMLDRR